MLCEDCPPIGYPTNKTRCAACPRYSSPTIDYFAKHFIEPMVVRVFGQAAFDADKLERSQEVQNETPRPAVTPLGDTHFHVCERCAEVWCHTKARVTPEERERLHRCPRCCAGPYIMAYPTRRDADDTRRGIREANAAAMVELS